MSTPESTGFPGGDSSRSREVAPPIFATTQWSTVLSAARNDSSRANDALARLCQVYWPPLYAFARRQGRTPHDAQDLTQEFFARLLTKDYLPAAAQEKGRFRTFLLVAFKRFLANEWDRQRAQKRGGGVQVVSIDHLVGETLCLIEPAHQLSPDVLFDRQWARTLLDRTMARLQDEYSTTGRAKLFELLRDCLVRDEAALPYAEISSRLRLTEAAVKMAVQRIRARYREILRSEIAETVASADEVEQEIRDLFATF